MIDVTDPESPGAWLKRLAVELEQRFKELEPLDARLRGDGPMPHVADNVRDSFRRFQRKSRTNWAELIVEAVRERMTVTGFRTAAEADAPEDAASDEAMRIWRANNLAVESADVHESMLGLRDGYVIVGDVDPATGVPTITGEDPLQVVTIHDPARPQRVRAALKMFHDDDLRRDFAYLYLPGELRVASRDVRRTSANPTVRFSPSSWDWDEDRSGALPDGLEGIVPVVRFRNRKGVGEFEHHLDLLDRIDFQVLQRLVIAAMQAHRQRAVTGELPEEDDDGHQIDYNDLFEADPGALWLLPEGAELWESQPADLTSVLSAVKDDIKVLSAVTKTPVNQLLPDSVAQTAEGAAFQRESLVFRAEDRIARATEGWRDVMSIAFRVLRDERRADRNTIEVLWAPAERRSLAERADAASKAQDIPWRSRMIHVWGFTPSQVDQMEVERTQDALVDALASAASEPPEPTPPDDDASAA